MDFTFDPAHQNGEPWVPALVGGTFAERGFCGQSLNRGLLRFHDASSGPIGQEFVANCFADLGFRGDVFAFDWRGRQFVVTPTLTPEGDQVDGNSERTVAVLDPFDMSITPWVPLTDFEHALSVPIAAEDLRPGLFDEWLRTRRLDHLDFQWCAGASVPAFYGGQLTIDNLSHDPVEVYLSFVTQLWAKARYQPAGSPVPHVSIHKDA
ncbi:MAG: hypothetical protein LLG14_16795 [Nocardiaceae bacterium]|nr:hypothetical protein [Nocardiaceae bacterium]